MAPDDPTDSNAPSEDSSPQDDETLDQDALDALFESGGLDAESQPQDTHSEAEGGVSRLMDQDEADALLAAQQREERVWTADYWTGPRPPVNKEPITERAILDQLMGEGYEPPAQDTSSEKGLLSQSDLDEFLTVQSETSHSFDSETLMRGPRPEIQKEPITDPAILSALMGVAPEEDSTVDDAGSGDEPVRQSAEPGPEPLDQAGLDELLAAQEELPRLSEAELLSGDSGVIEREPLSDPAVEAALMGTASPETVELAEESEEVLDQEALDRMLADELRSLAEDDPESILLEGDAEDVLDAADMDESLDEDEDADDSIVGQSDIDALFDSADTEEIIAPEGAPEEAGEAEVLAEAPEVAAVGLEEKPGVPEADEPASALDEIVEEAEVVDEDEELREEMDEVLDALADVKEDAGDVGEADEESMGELTEERVGSENIAAAATAEDSGGEDMLTQDLLDEMLAEVKDAEQEGPSDAAEPAEAEEPVPVVDDDDFGMAARDSMDDGLDADDFELDVAAVSGESLRRRLPRLRLPSSLKNAIRQHPYRLAVSLGIGTLCALSTYTYLYTHPLRGVSQFESMASGETQDLQRAIAFARDLMRKGEFVEAQTVLHDAIERAPFSPERVDAEFLRIESKFYTMSALPSPQEARTMHSEIDRLLGIAPQHLRAPEALLWKGKVYEAEDNLLAAGDTYRRILSDYDEPSNGDEVLFSLGNLEMDMGNAVEAGSHFQRLVKNYPASSLISDARLLMADAYAAAGDHEGARIEYIELIEQGQDDAKLAKAYERLGELQLASKDYAGAIRDLEARIQSATTVEGNDRIYLVLARAYRAEGRLQDAERLLDDLRLFFPESDVTPEAAVELSQVLNEMGRPEDAVELATNAVRRYPSNPAVLRNAGNLLAIAGGRAQAERALTAANAAGAADAILYLSAGRRFQEAGVLDEAEKAFADLIEVYPRSTEALEGSIEWARVVYAQGRIGKALQRLEDLSQATSLPQERLRILVALAELYDDLGMEAAVADIYRIVDSLTTEPELQARSALALLDAGWRDDGLRVADSVKLAGVTDKTSYELLIRQGQTLLQRDRRAGLDKMERAYEMYPLERTEKGDIALLKATLALNRAARARAIVAELQTRVLRGDESVSRSRLEKAATVWGDFLFERRDYRAAADAYATALGNLAYPDDLDEMDSSRLSTGKSWAMYQRANAMFNLADYSGSIELYDRVSLTSTDWAAEARAKANAARLEQRLRGDPVTPKPNAG